ncbi:MAG: DUF5675 family protein [Candidatus Paceibacterota bacterium]|jgi:hypothetical protein
MIRIIQIRLDLPYKDRQTISLVIVLNGTEVLFTCYLLELPWKNNKKNESCVPLGTYLAEKRRPGEGRFDYEHIEIIDVHNRSGIKWHIANYVKELRGCGAPGLKLDDIDKDGNIDVVSSRMALRNLLRVLPDVFTLTIIKE